MNQLHQLLVQSAERAPERIAVEDPSRDVRITYAGLHRASDRLRDRLLDLGVQPGDRVGLYAPKSIGVVAALFGALKAGAAYVPVDPGAPPARNAFIFKDCSVRAAVVERSRVEGLEAQYEGEGPEAVASLDELDPFGEDLVLLRMPPQPIPVPDTDNLSYILYTSGSTGKPKGVMHTHASALSFIDWCSSVFEPVPEDRFSSHAPFHFDLSILDLYVPLKHGATLVLIGEDLGKQPAELARVIAERGITAWYSTPSILRLLVEYGRMEQHDYGALRIVNFAGEVFPVKHLRALTAYWPHPRYFNLYGPTETNVCTYYEVELPVPEDRTEPYPIGYACSGDVCRVVDEHYRPVPAGEEGELIVSGGSVMRGYWNLPERNATAFHVDPDGTRWYKTGDVVRDAGQGCYLFVGRRDRMVKRRGYRVELGEIEAALYRHPAVTEAAVVALPDEQNGVLIKAFMNWTDEAKPSIIRLKQFCADNLPLYMIPDRFVFLDALPKTSTDKIDYQRLKAMA
ncbi:amino acid adenylation domain-containing protein [Rhodocaloribacter litoris]|uniref:amino acid adenylation domain-containing protein n=1 Tax=Rhodocaloribacter litoris TaxID=2558931 RepID=UPI0014207E60|nr:amino acid adenylation domain-containing protein [Rhodocaloribacter litoris]QXD14934.1 amino acid adenylation domain-containing protein [Rhodocaloribacter litoris]